MITLDSVAFSYKPSQQLIQDLNLSLERGKIYGLLGKNGTGKSTLLKLISGTRFPQSGSVHNNGNNTLDRNIEVLSNTYFLPEDFKLPNIRIRSFASVNGAFYPRFDEERFYTLLEKFEVDSTKKGSDLSFGQTKKVGIAFAIATNVDLLILDEPTNGLDIPSKSQLREALLTGFTEDQTVIISTHQVRDLNQLIESVIILEAGRILFHQPITTIEDRISFHRSLTEHESGSIYSELLPGGYLHLIPNQSHEPSSVELEVLFNAVISQPEAINHQF